MSYNLGDELRAVGEAEAFLKADIHHTAYDKNHWYWKYRGGFFLYLRPCVTAWRSEKRISIGKLPMTILSLRPAWADDEQTLRWEREYQEHGR